MKTILIRTSFERSDGERALGIFSIYEQRKIKNNRKRLKKIVNRADVERSDRKRGGAIFSSKSLNVKLKFV